MGKIIKKIKLMKSSSFIKSKIKLKILIKGELYLWMAVEVHSS